MQVKSARHESASVAHEAAAAMSPTSSISTSSSLSSSSSSSSSSSLSPSLHVPSPATGGNTNNQLTEKYVVDEDAALVILEEVYAQICCEDQTLRTFRRSLSFGNYIKRTLIPLLMSTKREPIIELTMRLLANLTLPVECLYTVDIMSRTEAGRKNIVEISAMLAVTKRSFANLQAMRAVVDYMRSILEKDTRISPSNCSNINNTLIVLRNVLHIPDASAAERAAAQQAMVTVPANAVAEETSASASSGSESSDAPASHLTPATQNQILYNLFALSIDKLLIHLMSCPQREYFAVAMVQLIALMYKDQQIGELQLLLASWFDASMSDSSEDFESNTTPMHATSGNSSPMLTSDSSSDHGGLMAVLKPAATGVVESPPVDAKASTTMGNKPHNAIRREDSGVIDYSEPGSRKSSLASNTGSGIGSSGGGHGTSTTSGSMTSLSLGASASGNAGAANQRKRSIFSEMSDCGYGTQVESSGRPEVVLTTSSNEDEQPSPPMGHQKPPATNQKQRYNAVNNPRSAIVRNDKRTWKRKKLVKRSKTNFIHMNRVLHHGPTDATIANLLKEFTVDFLLKCYDFLVKGLHGQLQTQPEPVSETDTSHFFWLITYFLKLTAQIELDLEHVKHVLSLGVISFLTYEGVSLSEELMLLLEMDGVDTRSCVRRLHLVVTSIKEYLQTLNGFKRIVLLSSDDKAHLHQLTLQISDLTGLQCLFVMLLRNFDDKIHTKQYLQDIIVTNHVLLELLDEASKYADYRGSVKMKDHIEQFATVEVMQQYGLLLNQYEENGEFVNDCIFTMMHHIGGDIGQLTLLFQPNILKTFSRIFETEYDLCDDWSDLIEYVMHKFLNTPQQSAAALQMPEYFPAGGGQTQSASPHRQLSPQPNQAHSNRTGLMPSIVWTKEEIESLYWYYLQAGRQGDVDPIGAIIRLYAANDQLVKTRIPVIQQLLLQDIITLDEYDDHMAAEDVSTAAQRRNSSPTSETGSPNAAAGVRRPDNKRQRQQQLQQPQPPQNRRRHSSAANGAGLVKDDIQVLMQRIVNDNKGKSLLWVQKTLIDSCYVKLSLRRQQLGGDDALNSWTRKRGTMEPIPLHYSLKRQAIPVVPWNSEQSVMHLYAPFMLLLHKLGFQLPVDSARAFVRIPAFWTADILFDVAQKLGPVQQSMLRFDLSDLHDAQSMDMVQVPQSLGDHKNITYGMHRRRSLIRFTPDPLTQYASMWLDATNGPQRWQPVQVDALAIMESNSLASVDRSQPSADLIVVTSVCLPSCTITAMTVTATTTTTTTITSSTIGSHTSAAAATVTTDAVAIDVATADGGASGGTIERFALRLPVLHESIDEQNDDDDDNVGDCNGNRMRNERTAEDRDADDDNVYGHDDDTSSNDEEGNINVAIHLQMRLQTAELNVEAVLNACETASVVSDSTHIYDLYVSDGEEP